MLNFASRNPTDGKFVIKSFARGAEYAPKKISGISILGTSGSLKFSQYANALTINVPGQAPNEYAYVLRISG